MDFSSIYISHFRIWFKRALKTLLAFGGIFSYLFKPQPGVRVLFYHRVNPYPFSELSLVSREISVTPEFFEQQLAYLKAKGYRSIDITKLQRVLDGLEPADPKELLITFDDGYEDNLIWAAPLLRKYGFGAIFFVVTEFIETGRAADQLDYDSAASALYHRFLSSEQITEMYRQGFLFGSHSRSHPDLIKSSDNELEAELNESHAFLETEFAKKVTCFAYPRGIFDERVMQATAEAGYALAFTTITGKNSALTNPMALKRTEISASDNMYLFKMKMHGALDWLSFKESWYFRCIIDLTNEILIWLISGSKAHR